MRTQGGSIVLFASAAAEIGIANHEAIAAAKAASSALLVPQQPPMQRTTFASTSLAPVSENRTDPSNLGKHQQR